MFVEDGEFELGESGSFASCFTTWEEEREEEEEEEKGGFVKHS